MSELAERSVSPMSHVRFAAVVECSDDAMIGLDLEGGITDWNPGAERMFGYVAGEILGKSIAALVPDDRRDEGAFLLERIRRGVRVESFETSRRTKDGRLIDVSVTAAPIKDSADHIEGALVIARDISVQKNLERELARLTRLYADLRQVNPAMVCTPGNDEETPTGQKVEAMARSELLFSATMIESLPGILYFYDQRGKFLRWNRNMEVVSGYTGEEISRMHPLDFFTGAEREIVKSTIEEVFIRGSSTVEAFFVSKDGRSKPYFFTGNRIVFDGAVCLVGVGVDVSERKRAEEALLESEELFNAFMDATPAIAWMTDSEGRHLFMNRAWDSAFGLKHAEWIGRTAFDLVPADVAERIRSSDAEVLEKDCAVVIPEEHGTLRGEPYYWNCIKFPFRNAAGHRFIGGIAIDITARKHAEHAKQAIEGRYRTLFEHAPDGIVIADADGFYVDANASTCRMLGYSREEFVGLHSSDIVVPDDVSRIEGALKEIKSDHSHNTEWRFRRKDGSVFEAEVIAALMPDGNILAMIRDISERKAAEAALRLLNENLEHEVAARTGDLQSALLRAEAADRIKSAFLATMSHELRTPLNSIIGFTGIVLQELAGPLNAEQSKQLGMVRDSARHLLELINDVLDLSKIEAGQLEVRAESFDLRESLRRVAALVGPMAKRKSITVMVVTAPEIAEILSDRRRVEQILLNLANNAIKFTETGRVSLEAEAVAEFAPSLESTPGQAVRLRITDTGIGIKAEDLGTLFQPFRQIDTGLARQHEGTGLGLTICRRLATLLGGEISVVSEWGKGTVFTVILPLRPHGPL